MRGGGGGLTLQLGEAGEEPEAEWEEVEITQASEMQLVLKWGGVLTHAGQHLRIKL
jgi:hypothetical protein